MLECGPDKTCYVDTCCANRKKDSNNLGNETAVRQRLNQNGGDAFNGDTALQAVDVTKEDEER